MCRGGGGRAWGPVGWGGGGVPQVCGRCPESDEAAKAVRRNLSSKEWLCVSERESERVVWGGWMFELEGGELPNEDDQTKDAEWRILSFCET